MVNKLKILTFIILIIFTSGMLWAQSAENKSLLSKAETAFKEGNDLLLTSPELAKNVYRSAANYYDSIISSGVVNAGLYYNLGNVYVRLEKPGKAILNYRKALLYSPNDSQIKYNLEYARSLQKNGFTLSTENEILHIIFFWHFMLSELWKAIIIIAANIVFWLALIIGRFGRNFGKTAVISLIVVLIMSGSFVIDFRSSNVIHGVITSESTIGRLGDSQSYEPAFDEPLYQGVEFIIEQKRVGWILAELPNGEQLWLEESDCGIVEEE